MVWNRTRFPTDSRWINTFYHTAPLTQFYRKSIGDLTWVRLHGLHERRGFLLQVTSVSQVMNTGHCKIHREVTNQTVPSSFWSTFWIVVRARRHFWPPLFICSMVTCTLTCGMWPVKKTCLAQAGPQKNRSALHTSFVHRARTLKH